MPQHDNVSRDDDARYVPNFPPLAAPAGVSLGDLEPAQLAALHTARARELHAEAASIHREQVNILRSERRLTHEWYELREPMVQPDAPRPSQRELDRVAWLEARMDELDDADMTARGRWQRRTIEAHGHELAAAYYGAEISQDAPTR